MGVIWVKWHYMDAFEKKRGGYQQKASRRNLFLGIIIRTFHTPGKKHRKRPLELRVGLYLLGQDLKTTTRPANERGGVGLMDVMYQAWREMGLEERLTTCKGRLLRAPHLRQEGETSLEAFSQQQFHLFLPSRRPTGFVRTRCRRYAHKTS